MARSIFTPTGTYALASGTAAVFTVKSVGEGQLFVNDVNTDDDAAEIISRETPFAVGLQLVQNLVKDTYIRATGTGWSIIVEEG